MTKIINFNYGNGKENFMLSTIEFQVMCNNKYLALKNDETYKYTEIILTNNNTSKTSKWKLLQSISTDKVMLFNVEAKSIITTSHDRKTLCLSSLKFDDNIWSYNIKTEIIINGSEPDILYPKSNNNITPKICFWNIIGEKILKLNQDGENIYLSTMVQNECCFEFTYKGKKIDFPGNCNIDGLITKESNCIYFNLQTGGKYCFTQSKNEVLIFFNEGSLTCNNFKQYVFDIRDIDLNDNSIERYSNGSSVRFWLKNDSEAQRWFILKDNFNRILIKPFKHNTFLDFHFGQLNEQAKLQNNWNSVHPANIYTVTSDNLIQIVNYNYNGYLNYIAITKIINDRKIYLNNNGRKINFYKAGSSEILTFNQLQFNELTGYENVFNTIIYTNITNSNFHLNNTSIFNEIKSKIDEKKYQYTSEKNEIELKKLLIENYFNNTDGSINLTNEIKFKYNNNNSLDMVDQIINSNIKLNDNYPLLKILTELYKKLKDKKTGSDVKWAEFILKDEYDSDFINAKEKLHSLGWNRYFKLTGDGNTIDSSYLSDSVNYLLNKLNIFIIHILDKIFYNGIEDLVNDFISLFTHDNKLCSFAITTNILYYINRKLDNKNNIFDTMLPTLTYDINKYGGIAYWNDNKEGYWCNSKTDVNWSIIECNDNKNSHWGDKTNESIISTDDYNNVFRVYTNINKKEYNISNNLNTNGSIDLLKTNHEHVINVPEQTYKYIDKGIFFKEYLNINDNLKIGYRPNGVFKKINKTDEFYDAYIFVTGKPEKIVGNTGNSVKSYSGKTCNDTLDRDDANSNPPYSSKNIPREVKMYLFKNNSVSEYISESIRFDSYNIGKNTKYGGYDNDAWNCGCKNDGKNASEHDIERLYYKIAIPNNIYDNEIKLDNKTFIKNGNIFNNYINNHKISLTNYGFLTDYGFGYGDGDKDGWYVCKDTQWIHDDDNRYLKGLYKPDDNTNERKFNNITHYGDYIKIDKAFILKNDLQGGYFYSGNVYGKIPVECSDIQNCNNSKKKLCHYENSNSNPDCPNARCFVVPNENLKIRLFDDRFDYMLLYWLNANKDSLSNKLKDEIIDLCLTNPKLLLPYRIWKNYIGCTKNNYINLENVIGPPLLYVPKESNLTEYTCYYAESSLCQNTKKIEYIYKKNDEIITEFISKFSSELINPTNFLDKLYYAFINLSNNQNVSLNENFYAYLTLRFNFSDLLNYINKDYNSEIELTILSDINKVEDFKNKYGFLITNDSQLEKANSVKFNKIGDYNVPYIINNTTHFEYKNKNLSFYFFSNYSPIDNTIDLTSNNINMVFSALTNESKEYNVIRMTSTYNKTKAANQEYLVPIDRTNF